VSLSFTLIKNEKVEHHIRMKTYKLVTLSFELRIVSMSYIVGLISICSASNIPCVKPNKNKMDSMGNRLIIF